MQGLPIHAPLVFPLSRSLNVASNIRGIALRQRFRLFAGSRYVGNGYEMATPGLTSGSHAAPARRLASGRAAQPSRVKLAAVETKMLAGFVIAMSLLLFGGGYTYRTSVEFANSVEWVAHTQEVRATLADLYGSLAGCRARATRLPPDPRTAAVWRTTHGSRASCSSGSPTRAGSLGDNPVQQKRAGQRLRTLIERAAAARMASGLTAYQTYGFRRRPRRAGLVRDAGRECGGDPRASPSAWMLSRATC